MKNTFKKIYLLILVQFCFCSCDDFVTVDLPSGQLTKNTVFEDKTTAYAAMADIYAKLRDIGMITGTGNGLSSDLGHYADELDYYGGAQVSTQYFYNNTLVPTNSDVIAWWVYSYNEIYAANAIIEGVASSSTLSVSDKNQLMGQALFVRAFLHFYLMNLYGNIPYITTTDYEHNKIAQRLPSDVVYSHLEDDLITATNLLSDDYLNAERIIPNKATAQALLARTYLYHGEWAEAANAASYVLNSNLYLWDDNIEGVFLKKSNTTLWQLMPITGGNTKEGMTFIFNSGPPKFTALSNNLIESFEPGDLRKIHWVAKVTDGTTIWYHANKYKQKSSTDSSIEYSIVLRLSEQYLIRAEARAQQGDLIGAKEDLNKIRHKAGLADTDAISQTQLLAAIQRERRVEFFTEFGHRFFDLKRTGNLDLVLTPLKSGWKSTDRLLPIPESELLLNPNLSPQNLGY